LGPGCPNCAKLAEQAQAAVDELGIEAEIEKITDIMEITNFGVMATPALAVDGQVKVVGKVPSTEEIKQMLS
jgi:small redox-active disulfide protein 2